VDAVGAEGNPLMAIKAVIFDFGGVVLVPLGEEYVGEWARRLGLSKAVLKSALWGEAWNAFELGQMDDETYRRRVGEALRLPDLEAVDLFFREFYAAEQLYPQVLDLIQRLRRTGRVKVALLTNAFIGHDQVMRRKWGLDPHTIFDLYINSAEVGLAKPDPAIYELALARLGVAPGEAIFIDDNLDNVHAAARLGIHAIHFGSTEALNGVIAQVEKLVGIR
jgi:epoxide hydrolase-like predicted phosphatase